MHGHDAKHHVHVQGRKKERRQPWLVLFLQLSYLQRKKNALGPQLTNFPLSLAGQNQVPVPPLLAKQSRKASSWQMGWVGLLTLP